MAAESIYDEILSRFIVDVASDIHRAAKTGQLPYSDLMAGSKRQPPLADEAEARRGEGDKKPSDDVDGNTEQYGANATRGAANVPSGKTSDGTATKNVDTAHEHKMGGVEQIIQQKQDPKEQKQNDGTAKIATANADKSTPNEGSDAKKRKVEFDKASKTTNTSNINIPPVLVVGTTSTLPPTKKGTTTTTTITPLPIIPPRSPTKPVYTDIYGRTPGKEPRYTIPCPNYPACTRNISCSRLAVHLEKCLGLPSSRRRNSSSTGNAGSSSGRRGSSASGGGANGSSAALSNNKSSGTSKGTKDSTKGSTKDKDHGRGSKVKDGKEGSSKGKGKQGKAAKRKSSKIV